jgi:hypothetical protein
MSALAPVLEPTLDLHPPHPLTPLDSALTDGWLSYKQNSPVSPLESALADYSPVTPLESALTKNKGGP